MHSNMNSDFDKVLGDALGKWHGILATFGIDVGDGRHRPCPLCGGKDRFRYDDKQGRGTWICNQCGAGDGLALLMRKTGDDFPSACKAVGQVVGTIPENYTPEKSTSPERLRELFKSSKPIENGDPVTRYLRNRGLTNWPDSLRYAPKCWEYETKQEQQAMLAVFTLPDGEAVTIHRTFIKDGQKLKVRSPKKVMPPKQKMTGGAIRLWPGESQTIGIAEGIETALAVNELYGVKCWAATSAILLESFKPPAWVKRVEIFADRDKNYRGQKAAYSLANRLIERDKIPAVVLLPKNGDCLEDLIEERHGKTTITNR